MEHFRERRPWKAQEIHRLFDEEFAVTYQPDYLGRFLRNRGLSYDKPRSERSSWPETGEQSRQTRRRCVRRGHRDRT
ncbi:hypothetical protein FYC77_19285 [Natrialba swarupiae]|uniref:Winged helix-turn helix domain-containing protein n=1 Tax=Natrialba swarupiae TaxID=2448032 RepID=A0A5D5AF30_9EURY|nr:hypothetical protein [Natrialba swarupiae]TYT60366.1 hypothetical protein FYC77_19285 [Natrialba swarupiae]